MTTLVSQRHGFLLDLQKSCTFLFHSPFTANVALNPMALERSGKASRRSRAG